MSALAAAAFALPIAALAANPAQLTLTVSATSVASPAPVTLTVSAMNNAAPLTAGSITFCDAASTAGCVDTGLVGTAQLTSTGTATIKTTPAIGTHRYFAVFPGTATAGEALSASQTVTVTGLYKTTTTVTATGNPSGYDLTATVVGFASQPPVLAGNVTFQDTTTNNLLGTEPLGVPVFAQSLLPAPGSPVQTGNAPAVAGVGDFNEDGIPDVAVVNGGDDTITVLLGKGDGTFNALTPTAPFAQSPCAVVTKQSNCAIAVGDFDHDGHADLAVTSGDDYTVSVLKGNGQGAFTPFAGSPIGTGNFPEAVKIGDFNNDGFQDLAVANANDGDVYVLLGNGDGTFTPAPGTPVAAGGFPFFLAVADLNNDGKADLAVVNGRTNTITLLQGNGDGTFTPFASSPIFLPAPTDEKGFTAIVAADFNEDGNADLAVADFDDSTVDILIGNATGAFTLTSQGPIAVGLNPFGLVGLDYNGDHHTDLAVSNFSDGTATLLIGKGDGTFAASGAATPAGPAPNDIVTADFNGDGKPDLALPDFGSTITTILLNTVTQTATAYLPNVILPGEGPQVVQATYPANTSFATSFGTITLEGLSIPTTLTLTDNPTAQLDTLPVTFTAQLSPTSTLAPTGTVTFFDDGNPIGTAPMGANGLAVFTTTTLGDGQHNITASYTGDAIFQASSSASLPLTISDLQIARVGKNDTTILPGTTVVYTLQVAPAVISTFLYNVTFSTSGLPAGAAASFSPATLAAGASTSTVTMTVTTARTALNEPPPSPFDRLPLALGLLLPLLGARAFRRRLRQVPPFLMALLLAALSLTAVAGLSGCAGAGLFAARKVPYTITVTANEGTAAFGTLSRSTGVPLAIQ
jgi:hypothetical protein